MNKIILLFLSCFLFSCSTAEKSGLPVTEDRLFITRKYIGDFLSYIHTGPEVTNGTDLIWIKTTRDNSYGKISAYGRTCGFSSGDKLYLNSKYSPGCRTGDWEYEIGNDSLVLYTVSDFRIENNKIIRTWGQ